MTRRIWIVMLVLATASVVGILIVALTDKGDASLGVGSPLIPELETRAQEIHEITIVLPGGDEVSDTDTGNGIGVTTISFWNDDRRWHIREHNDYFADVSQLSQLVVTLSAINLQEPKTRVHDKHERLGLGAPEEGGSATRISLYGSEGVVIANILLGDDALSRSGQYVRHADQDQTWLASPAQERLSGSSINWLAKPLLRVPVEDVRSVVFMNDQDGESYRISREAAGDPLTINPPDGYKVDDPSILNDWATVMENLDFENVLLNPEPADDSLLAVQHTVRLNTFEGMTVIATIGNAALSESLLMRVLFMVEGGEDIDETVYNKVAQHNEDYGSWLYEISDVDKAEFVFVPDTVFVEIEVKEEDKAEVEESSKSGDDEKDGKKKGRKSRR